MSGLHRCPAHGNAPIKFPQFRAMQVSRRPWHGACASTKAGLTRSEASVIGSRTDAAGHERACPFGVGEADLHRNGVAALRLPGRE
jgi:hypothetical protein